MFACSDSVPLTPLILNGADLRLDPMGALWWPDESVLVVADLHLEKGSAFARRGQMLPPYDTTDTVSRLETLVRRWDPRVVVALGDSLHDSGACARLDPAILDRLRGIQVGRAFIWIAGNHDPEPNPDLGGEWHQVWRAGPLVFRHAPSSTLEHGEVAGHLHPVARLVVRGRGVRRRCFVTDGMRMILPALGAYAGGLNVRDRAFQAVFGAAFEAHLLGADRTYRIAGRACLPD